MAPSFAFGVDYGGVGVSVGGSVGVPITDQAQLPDGYGCVSGVAQFVRRSWRAGGELGVCGNPITGNVVTGGLSHGFTKHFGPLYLTGYNTLGLGYWQHDGGHADQETLLSTWSPREPSSNFRAFTAYMKPQVGIGFPLPGGAIELSTYASLHAPIAQWIPYDTEPVRVIPGGGIEVSFLWGQFRKMRPPEPSNPSVDNRAPLPGTQPMEVNDVPPPPSTAVETEKDDRPLAIPADKRR